MNVAMQEYNNIKKKQKQQKMVTIRFNIKFCIRALLLFFLPVPYGYKIFKIFARRGILKHAPFIFFYHNPWPNKILYIKFY